MKRSRLLAIAALLVIATSAGAAAPARQVIYYTTLPTTCNASTGDVAIQVGGTNPGFYYCSSANSWTLVGGTVGTFLAANGTAAAPSYAFASDTDTGMYRVAANQLGLTVAGARVMLLTSVANQSDVVFWAAGGFQATGANDTYSWSTKSALASAADGRINLTNAALTGFTRLVLGPEAVTHPAFAVSAAVSGQTQGVIILKGDGTAATFANLGAATNGSMIYCSDCTIANPCAGSGNGALAKRLNGAWVCN